MATVPETAAQTEGLRRVVIDPVTRVEGHGKVTLLLDQNHRVQQARLHIVEFRGLSVSFRVAPTGKFLFWSKGSVAFARSAIIWPQPRRLTNWSGWTA